MLPAPSPGDWLRRVVIEAIRLGKEGNFRRSFRGGNYQLIVDSSKNKAGCFLRVLKIQNGNTRMVIIPAEYAFKGWEKFGDCMQSFFSNKNSNFGDTLEDKQESLALRDWKRAITVYRSNTRLYWEEISGRLESITKRKSDLFQVAADRAIFWCWEEQEFERLLSKPDQLSDYKTKVSMGRWRKEDHWQNLQISVSYSWIGIEGLPLMMWNIHVFTEIGEACGGLLEVAEETMNKTFLGYAKMKVKGFVTGLMNPIVEIICEGEKVCLGAFAVRGPKGGACGYRTAGNTTRAILNMSYYGSNKGETLRHGNVNRILVASTAKGNLAVCVREDASDDVDVRGDKTAAQKKHMVQLCSASSDKTERDRVAIVTHEDRLVSPNASEAGHGEWVRRANSADEKQQQIMGIVRGERSPKKGSRIIYRQADSGSKHFNMVYNQKTGLGHVLGQENFTVLKKKKKSLGMGMLGNRLTQNSMGFGKAQVRWVRKNQLARVGQARNGFKDKYLLTGHGEGPWSGVQSPGLELNGSNKTIFFQGAGTMLRGKLNGPGLRGNRAENYKTRLFSNNKNYGPLLWPQATYNQILQKDKHEKAPIRETHIGDVGRRSFQRHLAKIKPKITSSFFHGNIFSSHTSSSSERNRDSSSSILRV